MDATTTANGFDPFHYYYGFDGEPISMLEWANRFVDAGTRCVRRDDVVLPGRVPGVLVTTWLGFVVPHVREARLYGTALIRNRQHLVKPYIEVYDTRADAVRRHHVHVLATRNGFHCARCRDGLGHVGSACPRCRDGLGHVESAV